MPTDLSSKTAKKSTLKSSNNKKQKELFIERVEKWSTSIGVHYVSVQFRSMTNKWASCSSKGRLTFDSNLLTKPKRFQDEVIVHELLHLRYPHHNTMFKQMFRIYLKKKI